MYVYIFAQKLAGIHEMQYNSHLQLLNIQYFAK